MDDLNNAAAQAESDQPVVSALQAAADVAQAAATSTDAVVAMSAKTAVLSPDEVAKIATDAIEAAMAKLPTPSQVPGAVITAVTTDLKPMVNLKSVVGVLVLLAGYFLAKDGHAVDPSVSTGVTDSLSQLLVVGGALLTDLGPMFGLGKRA